MISRRSARARVSGSTAAVSRIGTAQLEAVIGAGSYAPEALRWAAESGVMSGKDALPREPGDAPGLPFPKFAGQPAVILDIVRKIYYCRGKRGQ